MHACARIACDGVRARGHPSALELVQNELVDVHEAIERRRQELGVLDCRLKHWLAPPQY